MSALPLPRLLGGVCALWLALLAVAAARACTTVAYAGGDANLVIDTWDDTVPDVLISNWTMAGNANFLNGCSVSSPSPVDVIPTMPNLTFEHDVVIDGERYPAYSVVGMPRTPLFIFRYVFGNGSAVLNQPFDASRTLNSSGGSAAGAFRWSVLQIAAVSRGGQMEALPTTSVGSARHVFPPNPSLSKVESFSVTANLRSKTCTLTDTPVALLDVHSGDLPRAGSSAGTRDFNVAMSCNGTYTVYLSLTDANAPGSTSSRLTPTRNATAEGVRVELLRGGSPVALGSTWSQLSREPVALAARYYRESGAFGTGLVEGQAVITVTYR